MENKIHQLLCELGISEPDAAEKFFPYTRDKKDIAVMRCKKSGVIFLSQSSHIEQEHYLQKDDLSFWGVSSREEANKDSSIAEDDKRRAAQFADIIRNKTWLDVGTGPGGVLDLLRATAGKCAAVEPQKGMRNELIKSGYTVYSDIEEADEEFDVVTLFHVFEHLTEPLDVLKKIKVRMKPGGKLIIEVPHGNDFLLSFKDLDSFKAFTFRSDHLILHTRESLRSFLQQAAFNNVSIMGFQRYPLANHLYWLANHKPGGHLAWSHLKTPALDSAYGDMLARLDKTDTLIAVAEK